MLHMRLLTVLGAGIGILFMAAAAMAQPAADGEGAPPQSAASQVRIPAGEDLGAALDDYIRQTGVQLIYRDEEVLGLQTGGTDGAATHEAALTELLEGTGLTITRDPSGAMAIADPSRLPASSAAGQNTIGQRRKGIEEIIVTGQKREERIQDVPIAISAFTMEDLKTSQIAGGPDLHLQVPNMTFTKTNFTGYSIQIRGIGTQAISATTDPAVAVALNNTPFIRNNFFEQEFYDLERLEVLRGPQGTLYGRNATAGVVNLITAKPKFQDESMFSLDQGNYDSRRWEFMINKPLVDDQVALRIAGAGTKRDGYATNELTGNPIDGRDLWSTRVSLRVAPTNGNFDLNLMWEHFEEDDQRLRSGKQLCKKDVVTDVGGTPIEDFVTTGVGSWGANGFSGHQAGLSQGCERNSLYAADSFQTPNGSMLPFYLPLSAIFLPAALEDPYASGVQSRDLRVIESTLDPEYRVKADIAQIQFDYELTDTLLLESETAYSQNSVFSLQDFNRFNSAPGAWSQPVNDEGAPNIIGGRPGVLQEGPDGGIFCDPQLGCSDRLVVVDVSAAESRQWSQELRVSSQFDGLFDFSLGANYLRYDNEDKYYVFSNSFTLAAASFPGSNTGPWVPGESTNEKCLINGLAPHDPSLPANVSGTSCQYIEANPIGELQDIGHNYFLSRNPYELRSYGVFGETYWRLADNLKLTAGLRWSVDKKTAPRIPSQLLAGYSVGYPTLNVVEQEWREPTGRLVLDWKPVLGFTDETLIYGSYSHGYKAGGTNPPPFRLSTRGATIELIKFFQQESATTPRTFDAEFVDAFEIGTKNTLLDGTLTFNAAAFYYDYQDYQISEIVERSAFNKNYDAEVWGLEIEADWWALENLRLGFKGGYQKTRIADGEQAIDLMDRTAGGKHFTITNIPNPNFDPDQAIPESEYVAVNNTSELPAGQEFFAFEDWILTRPFPAFPSSCVLPKYLFVNDGALRPVGNLSGGGFTACELAYLRGQDPVTALSFEPNPTEDGEGNNGRFGQYVGYPGFDPFDESMGHNFGDGFFKDLGGNEFPNAPHYTLTLTADYIVPLRGDWILDLHTDIYWQSKAWWRIFNDHEYNRLDPYFTMNLAAIFKNEVSGWDIMAYVKNVTDEDAITGAFLYSDDTALTTNVFLVEPRLAGIRVTKHWDGGGPSEWLGQAGSALLGKEPGEPSPWELTVGAQMYRPKEPQNEIFAPAFISANNDPGNGDPTFDQGKELDWGDGREIELAYAPGNGWRFSLGARFGESTRDERSMIEGNTLYGCAKYEEVCTSEGKYYGYLGLQSDIPPYEFTNYGVSDLKASEEHLLIDFEVGRDVGLGEFMQGTLSAGLRYANFKSKTDVTLYGTPDWQVPSECLYGCFSLATYSFIRNTAQHSEFYSTMNARREFEGVGPVLSWEASNRLIGDDTGGRLDLDWSLSGGVLFGRQKTSVEGEDGQYGYYDQNTSVFRGGIADDQLAPVSGQEGTPFNYERDDDRIAAVPTLNLGLGLTYRLDGFSIGGGYNWERYYGVIDGGIEERKAYDRTIEGPYLKVTFGGGE